VNPTLIAIVAVSGVALLLLLSGLRLIHEYQRGVVFRLGKYEQMLDPGLRVVIPLGIDRVNRVDVRTTAVEVPSQDVITVDNVMVRVLAAVYFQVVNPPLAVTKVANYRQATAYLVQSSLRSFIGRVSLHQLLTGRDLINEMLRRIVDEETEPWGITVSMVEFKDVQLPEALQKAMGREAEAEREKNAKIITADGELAAAQRLSDAAELIADRPNALQLRYLQALTEIGGSDRNTVVVFPVPFDLMQPLLDMQARMTKTTDNGGASQPAGGGSAPSPPAAPPAQAPPPEPASPPASTE
jgi:regulator of protease activity HflC (stomatin/prohibitin superfamily)